MNSWTQWVKIIGGNFTQTVLYWYFYQRKRRCYSIKCRDEDEEWQWEKAKKSKGTVAQELCSGGATGDGGEERRFRVFEDF